MLQRAASNAYSWWWASHIRTKQSKWMEQNLLDMEEKVQYALKLIEEDGDSFARRAEMYYKKRPELINFVEESYRAYRALAERYDHISTELQNANNTIASVFPEQVQFSMDEEDEESMPRFKKKQSEISKANIPKVPKGPADLKTVITTATNKLKSKKNGKLATLVSAVVKSGLNKEEALHEIDKLQKQILALQTEKEFTKSSYESRLARYWEIENQIKEIQDRVFNLQDEYGEGMVIEDDEARNLMAKAALKSCQESIAQLQEKQERSAEEARIESTRVREVRERLDSLKGELHGEESSQKKPLAKNEPAMQKKVPGRLNQEVDSAVEEKERAEKLRHKIKVQLEGSTCLTMTEMAEKIDELVNKVFSLENALSSQTTLIKQLRSEIDELQTQIRTLKGDKASIINGKKKNNLQQKLKEMEKKLGGIQNLNQKVENEKSNFHSQIIEVHCNLDHLSVKLPSVQQDEEPEPESSLSTVQIEQSEKLPGVNLGASEQHTELKQLDVKQPYEKLKAHEGSDDPKQMRSDEASQVTDSRRNDEPTIEMKSSQLQSPKEEESQNFKGKSEKADASGMNRNQENIGGSTQVDPPKLGSSSKKLDVRTTSRNLVVEVADTQDDPPKLGSSSKKLDVRVTSRNLVVEVADTQDDPPKLGNSSKKLDVRTTSRNLVVEVADTQDKSQSSKGSYEKSDTDAAAKGGEEIVQALSVNTNGNPEKNDAHGSAGNPVEFVQTKANSHYSEGGREEAGMNATSRSLVEVVQTQDKSQSSIGSYEKSDEEKNVVKNGEGIVLALSVNIEGNPEKNGTNGSNGNPVEVVQTKANSQYSEGCREEVGVNATSRSLVVVQTQDKSQSSIGSYEKSDEEKNVVKSREEIVLALSVNTEGNPEKNGANGSAGNPVEVVQTKANSRYSEGDCEEAGVNATSRNQVEVVQTQDKSQSSIGSYEKSDAENTVKSQEATVLALSVNTEGNPAKNGDNGSTGNSVEVVQATTNSQYSEGGVNGTLTSKVEEIHKKENLKRLSKKREDVMKEQNKEETTEPNWQQLFLTGIEDREKALLTEYTTTLRNFKDARKTINDMDEKSRDHHIQTTKKLSELKTSNALKDQEIRSLRHKLNLMQKCFYESKESMDLSTHSIDFSASDHQKISSTSEDGNVKSKTTDNSAQSATLTRQISDDELEFDISKLLIQQPTTTSEIEEGLRMKIDELLEENLDFWLKFSTSFHQIQKFKTGIQDLKLEVTKLQEKGKKMDESGSGDYSLKSEARPLYKHLREIQTELNVWSDQSSALKEELQHRFSSLCNIQEDITAGLKASAEDDDFSFTSYQAAKFQGEVLNMKQENNKVADELQAALDHIASLQVDVETTLSKLNEEFGLSGTKKPETQMRHSVSPNSVPLRSFIFGVKQKKQKQSIFSGMAPVMQKKYYAMRTGTL